MRGVLKKIGVVLAVLAGIVLLTGAIFWVTFAPRKDEMGFYIHDPFSKFEYCIAGEEVHIVGSTDVKEEDGYLELPDSFWGKPVTVVSLHDMSSQVERVYVPDSVTNVQRLHGIGLREVTGGINVEVLGDSVFQDCRRLTNVEFVDNDAITVIPEEAFYGCDALKEIVLGKNVTTIEHNAFTFCVALETVEIGDAIECIERSAFGNTPWEETPKGKETIEKYEDKKD